MRTWQPTLKLLCCGYIEGDGDSDQYDTEEETEMVKNLTEEEKKLYDEYRDVYIKQTGRDGASC